MIIPSLNSIISVQESLGWCGSWRVWFIMASQWAGVYIDSILQVNIYGRLDDFFIEHCFKLPSLAQWFLRSQKGLPSLFQTPVIVEEVRSTYFVNPSKAKGDFSVTFLISALSKTRLCTVSFVFHFFHVNEGFLVFREPLGLIVSRLKNHNIDASDGLPILSWHLTWPASGIKAAHPGYARSIADTQINELFQASNNVVLCLRFLQSLCTGIILGIKTTRFFSVVPANSLRMNGTGQGLCGSSSSNSFSLQLASGFFPLECLLPSYFHLLHFDWIHLRTRPLYMKQTAQAAMPCLSAPARKEESKPDSQHGLTFFTVCKRALYSAAWPFTVVSSRASSKSPAESVMLVTSSFDELYTRTPSIFLFFEIRQAGLSF